MPQPILTELAQATCPHQAKNTFKAGAAKVLIENGPPLVAGDRGTIAGCPFTVPSGKPQPCVTGLVTQTSSKVMAEGRPVILQSPGDICQSGEQIPQGALIYSVVQSKVVAT